MILPQRAHTDRKRVRAMTIVARKKIYNCILMFAAVSLIGWILETACFLVRWHVLTDRGFLLLPLCPIYGASVLAVYLLMGTPKNGRLEALFDKSAALPPFARFTAQAGLYALYFAVAALIPTAAEFLTAFVFDKLFGLKFWDYSYHSVNLFGYVSLVQSALWGAMLTAAMALVWPPMYRAFDRLPEKTARRSALLAAALICADFAGNALFLLITGHRFALLP